MDEITGFSFSFLVHIGNGGPFEANSYQDQDQDSKKSNRRGK